MKNRLLIELTCLAVLIMCFFLFRSNFYYGGVLGVLQVEGIWFSLVFSLSCLIRLVSLRIKVPTIIKYIGAIILFVVLVFVGIVIISEEWTLTDQYKSLILIMLVVYATVVLTLNLLMVSSKYPSVVNATGTVMIYLSILFISALIDLRLKDVYEDYTSVPPSKTHQITSEILELDSFSINARFLRACSLVQLGEYDKANEDFSFLENNPNRLLNDSQLTMIRYQRRIIARAKDNSNKGTEEFIKQLTKEEQQKLTDIKPFLNE